MQDSLNFKEVTRAATAIMVANNLFYKKDIKYQEKKDCLTETISYSNKEAYGLPAIIQYLQLNFFQLQTLDFIYYLQYQMIEKKETKIQQKIKIIEVIPNKKYKKIEKSLQKQHYLGGGAPSDLDIIAYYHIIGFFKLNDKNKAIFPKCFTWFQKVQNFVEAAETEVLKPFKSGAFLNLLLNQGANEQATDKKKDKKEKKENRKDKKQQAKEQQQAQPQKQKLKKTLKEVDETYLKQVKQQKIYRMDKTPLLPSKTKKNVLITSALPYVNNVPHLGNIIGAVLSADVYSRYCRLKGYNVIYVCGTDEYGTATEMKALQEKLHPKEICDKYHKIHKEIYDWFDIDFDIFGRTTTEQQTQIAQDIFLNLQKNGFLNIDSLEQFYCNNCQQYLSDRFIIGICPFCNSDKAKGDQCDGCQKLLNPAELLEKKCSICKQTPELRQSDHVFLDLTKCSDELKEWVEKSAQKGDWSSNAKSITDAWINQGLKKRCITRNLKYKWGTPVPLKGFEHQVFYVWFDAPIGYISITANYTKEWEQWWKNPENVDLIQFMGKDNIPFHTVIFPSSLIGSRSNWTLLHHIASTEYLNYEGTKFSKSFGTGVFGNDVFNLGIDSDIWRYYLLAARPEKSDADFSWQEFANRNNNELLQNVGNLCQRLLKFIFAKYNAEIPKYDQAKFTKEDTALLTEVHEQIKAYIDLFEKIKIKDALNLAMHISSICNKYIQDQAPWDKKQQETGRSNEIIGIGANLIRVISALLEPFVPSLSAKMNFLLGFETRTEQDDILLSYLLESNSYQNLLTLVKPQQKIKEPVILIHEITQEVVDSLKQKFSGVQQQQ